MSTTDDTIGMPTPPVSSSTGMMPQETLLQRGAFDPPLTPGTLGCLERFEILRLLGEGGMGLVYLAREPRTDTRVAIKIVKPRVADDPQVVHRFLTEARHMYRLSHPRILRVLEVSDRKESPYYVMPYIENGSLLGQYNPEHPMSTEQILAIAPQVAEALAYAHAHGLIHRDLKPGNVLLDKDGNAYLTDFGLVRTVFNDSMVDASASHLEGTAPYMSPAVARGEAEDTRCDIYAFGALLYELLTGQPPYTGRTPQMILDQILKSPPLPIRTVNPKASPALVKIAEGCMARELRDRYASMADVVSDFNRATKGQAPFGPHRQQSRLPRIAALIVGTLTVAALAGATVHHFSSSTQPGATVKGIEPTANSLQPPVLPYTYTTNNNAITITKYTGQGGDVTIPSSINGLTVTGIGDKAFSECLKLTKVTIPNSITTIKPEAFSGCINLANLTIPNSVTIIGSEAFGNCRALTSLTIPGSLTTIEKAAFGSCSAVRTITLADGVTSIGTWAFAHCTSLTSITIPNSVTRIEDWAFENCTSLVKITIPASVISIGENGIFRYCSGLSSITVDPANPAYCNTPDGVMFDKKKTRLLCYPGGRAGSYVIPDGVTKICGGAFHGSTSLTTVTVPKGVTAIDYRAFRRCSELTELYFHGDAPTLGTDIFSSTPKATIYYLPTTRGWGKEFGGRPTAVWKQTTQINSSKNVTELVENDAQPSSIVAIPSTTKAQGPFNYTTTNGMSTITKYTGPGGDVVIPDKINGLPVTGIDSAFRDCTNLTNVVIPNTVTTIASFSFSSCTALTNIFVPASVTNMGSNPFIRCDRVTSITVDAKNPTYSSENGVLFDKERTALLVFPAGRTGSYAVPDRVTRIKGNAFRDCHGLTGVTVPPSVELIEFSAFSRCPGLSGVYFSGDAPNLGAGAFSFCNATIYHNPITKGWGKEFGGRPTAVWEPEKDAKPSLPQTNGAATPDPLVEGPFTYTVKDGTVTIVKYTGPGEDVTIPDKINGLPVTSIGGYAFSGCAKMTGVTIPNSVTSIGAYAFRGCAGLTSVWIPASVNTIGGFLFSGCTALTTIKVDAANSAYCSFDGVLFDKQQTSPLICPEGKVGTYRIPSGVIRISRWSFADCTKLAGITIPDSVTEIGDNAFAGCSSLTTITIPSSMSLIQVNSFNRCSALTAIIVDEANPFYSSADGVLFNKQKTHLVICPGGKTGNYAIPEGITKINPSAFAHCQNLSAIAIPASVNVIGLDAFLYCDKLVSIRVVAANPDFSSSVDGVLFNKDKSKLVRCPPGKAGSYVVPGGVASIESTAFGDCTKLTDITLPDSVSQISDDYAFSGCSLLTRVEIGKGLRSIGKHAFYPCVNLSWVVFSGDAPAGDADVTIFLRCNNAIVCHLPESKGWGKTFAGRPTALWDSKLRSCYTTEKDAATLTKYIGSGGDVTIPDKINGLPVTTIAESAFQNCTTLTSLTVPEGIKSIMGRAFDGCGGLTKVTLPASVTSMGVYGKGQWNPFVNCPKLDSITVDAANPSFRSNANGVLFNKEMTALLAYPGGRAGSYAIPNGVTSVGLAAFEGCCGLTDVSIPRSVTSLGPYSGGRASNPFVNCLKLTSIALDQANPSYSIGADGVVFSKDKAVLVCYPSGKAGSYTIPDGVTSIGESAFAFCPLLSSVTLPASVTLIGYEAFMNSGELTGIFFKGNAPGNVAWNAFQGADKATIYYLPGTKGWGKEFGGRPTAVWKE